MWLKKNSAATPEKIPPQYDVSGPFFCASTYTDRLGRSTSDSYTYIPKWATFISRAAVKGGKNIGPIFA